MNPKLNFLVVVLLLSFCTAFSQETLKIGHVNIPELVQQMPETDSIQAVLNKEAKEMEAMYSEMLGEHEKNVQKFENESSSYSEFVRKTKEAELMESAGKIQQFHQNATQQLQKRNVELLQPVYQKINEAISQVAGRDNFTYILDLGNGAVVFHAEHSQDLNPLVLAEIKKQ